MDRIHTHTRYLRSDFRGEMLFWVRSVILISARYFWTIYNRTKCFIIGVAIARKTTFIGNCIFDRHQLSIIRIAERCEFVSSSYYNLIGVNHSCVLSTHSERAIIAIGNNCGFSGTVIGAFTSITIGNNVRCGANTIITDSDWHLGDSRTRQPGAVVIGDNVWLGVNAVVLKGVTIGDNAVIGAGSVVNKDIPSNVMACGNPCKVKKAI